MNPTASNKPRLHRMLDGNQAACTSCGHCEGDVERSAHNACARCLQHWGLRYCMHGKGSLGRETITSSPSTPKSDHKHTPMYVVRNAAEQKHLNLGILEVKSFARAVKPPMLGRDSAVPSIRLLWFQRGGGVRRPRECRRVHVHVCLWEFACACVGLALPYPRMLIVLWILGGVRTRQPLGSSLVGGITPTPFWRYSCFA